ncbi:mechanosensitive ion channel family protein [Agarilytica rhodophyticola]|uniref:mechanosensitive ion channel family protein n=1 Tax=Agarilytica rhodophyticola TaxID=1737490 RepID=UPI000B343032|nr:mechanosensitive ion channel family protein [Agarilytica rhodophyticola]
MESWWKHIVDWLIAVTGKENLWVIEVFFVVFATLIVAFVVSRFMAKLELRASKTKNLWDDALFESLSRPLKWFIWAMGLSYAATIISNVSASVIFSSVETVRHVAAIVIVTWFFNGFITRVEKNVINPGYIHKPMDRTTAMAVGKLLRISVVITSVLIGLQSLGYSISGVLAFGGVGGIAVGFAAKDLLANFFGGLMIYLDRPFTVGDWVRSPDKDIEGTVEDIGWRLTRIRTFDKRPLYVPNSTFTQIAVENPSRMLNRRIYETVGIRYDDAEKMSGVVNAVKAMVQAHEDIDQNQMIMVNFNVFSPSSLDFFVYCFTKTTDWARFHEVKQDVMLKILDIIDDHGAECAFPTSTIHIPEKIVTSQNSGA